MWNAMYIVEGREAIFGAVNLWCSINDITVKINRIGAQRLLLLSLLSDSLQYGCLELDIQCFR